MSEGIGYEQDVCHFCKSKDAGYGRQENGRVYDACHKCAKKAKFKGDESGKENKNGMSEMELWII